VRGSGPLLKNPTQGGGTFWKVDGEAGVGRVGEQSPQKPKQLLRCCSFLHKAQDIYNPNVKRDVWQARNLVRKMRGPKDKAPQAQNRVEMIDLAHLGITEYFRCRFHPVLAYNVVVTCFFGLKKKNNMYERTEKIFQGGRQSQLTFLHYFSPPRFTLSFSNFFCPSNPGL